MTKKKLSLGERIALAASGSQEEEFPEDIEYEASAKVIDEDDLEEDDDHPGRRRRAPGRSSLRTKNVQLLDELDTKYAGQKVTRKKLTKDDGPQVSNGSGHHLLDEQEMDFSLDDDDDDEDGLDASGDVEDDGASDSDLGVDGDDQESGEDIDDDEDDDDEDEISGSEVEVEGDEEDAGSDSGSGEGSSSEVEVDDFESVGVKTLSARDKQEEIEKGKATLNQIRIWDSLLEVRIRLQKMLLDCSRLPQGDQFQEALQNIGENDESSKLPKILENGQAATKVLMHELLRLQELMTQGFPETQKASTTPKTKATKSGDSEEITSEDDDDVDEVNDLSKKTKRIGVEGQVAIGKKRKLEDFLESSEASFKKLMPFRNETIKKWNEKTQFAGGKFNRKTASQQISTLRQIEQILGNRERLLKRTQVKRSNYSMIMTTSNSTSDLTTAEPDPETFDDDDFYHQLLRELIERKTTNVNDPIQLSHHWLELQKLRTKLKRKVDTKASKGRRLRYEVHSKLVNFMAPRDNLGMTPAAVKELFGSLFGKKRE